MWESDDHFGEVGSLVPIFIFNSNLPVLPFSSFRFSLIFCLLCDFSQRDDKGKIPEHPREA